MVGSGGGQRRRAGVESSGGEQQQRAAAEGGSILRDVITYQNSIRRGKKGYSQIEN